MHNDLRRPNIALDNLWHGLCFTTACLALVACHLFAASTLFAQAEPVATVTPGLASTVAGNGMASFGGDGVPATSAKLNSPIGIAVDSAGNQYIADTSNNRIREVMAGSGTIVTIAGTGTAGYNGDGGQATAAELAMPLAVALDSTGDLYIADTFNNRIRKVTGGIITTVAGNGNFGFSGDGGPAISAEVNDPRGIAVDSSGNLYIADTNNQRIRKVVGGTINTIAGSGTRGYAGDGGAATSAELNYPFAVAVDASGNVYIADTFNNVIRKVTGTTISTVAGDQPLGAGYSGDAGPATAAQLNDPSGIAVDAAGDQYIVDSGNNVLRQVNAVSQTINTLVGFSPGNAGFAGDGGPATSVEMNGPSSAALDAKGDLFIVDTNNNRVREVSASGAPLFFPQTAEGSASPVQTVTVNNIGNASLMFSNIAATTNYMVDSGTTTCSTGSALPSGQTCTVGVVFMPATSCGTTAGTLTLTDNSTGVAGSMQTVTLSGFTPSSTTTGLTNSPSTSTGGQVVIFTSTVTACDGQTPTGSVTFTANGSHLGTYTLTKNGIATASYSALVVGTYTVAATYNGGATFLTSTSPSVMQTVDVEPTTTMLVSSTNPTTGGQSVTFTATVNASNGAAPVGSIAFTSNGQPIGTVALNGAGVAALSVSNLPSGTDAIVGTYTGSTRMSSSKSNTVMQTVSQLTSTTTLMSSTNPSVGGQSVTFTATVTTGSVTPTGGTVAFSNGATMLGTVNLGAGGTASLSTAGLPLGMNSIKAVYSGSPYIGGSTSMPLTQTVSAASTTTMLTSTPNPSMFGSSVAFTATVTASGGGIPTGTVSFKFGSMELGNVALSNGMAVLNYSNLPVGTDSITATYTGSHLATASMSTPLAQTVN